MDNLLGVKNIYINKSKDSINKNHQEYSTRGNIKNIS